MALRRAASSLVQRLAWGAEEGLGGLLAANRLGLEAAQRCARWRQQERAGSKPIRSMLHVD